MSCDDAHLALLAMLVAVLAALVEVIRQARKR